MDTIKLLPCRVCGGAAEFSLYSEGVYVAGCVKEYCASLPICGAGSKEEAAIAWNEWAIQEREDFCD